MATDELVACWAALVAYVEDVHAPQYNLTAEQWAAAERLLAVLDQRDNIDGEDRILLLALGVMLDLVDPPDLDAEGWATAERMLKEYTAKVDAS